MEKIWLRSPLCFWSTTTYEPLPDYSLSGKRKKPAPKSFLHLLHAVFIIWNICLLVAGIYGANAYISSQQPHGARAVSCDCGATIDEAISLGCKYDTLSVSWLPPHCRDDDLTDEFDHAGTGPNGEWPYYMDREMTRLLTIHEVSMLAALPITQAQFWTTFGWHVSHCSFYWRKEFRMREKGLMVEHRYDRESHIKHCHKAFVNRTPLNTTNTRAAVGLGGDTIGGVRTETQIEHEGEPGHTHGEHGHEGHAGRR